MKKIITKQKVFDVIKEEVKNFIYENYHSDIEKMERDWGLELIDSKVIDGYRIFLIHYPQYSLHQIGLTSRDQGFSTPPSQEKIELEFPPKNIKKILTEMKKIIIYWLEKYSNKITIGSYHKEKTIKYRNILNYMGFNLGEIFYLNNSWLFELKK